MALPKKSKARRSGKAGHDGGLASLAGLLDDASSTRGRTWRERMTGSRGRELSSRAVLPGESDEVS